MAALVGAISIPHSPIEAGRDGGFPEHLVPISIPHSPIEAKLEDAGIIRKTEFQFHTVRLRPSTGGIL